VLTHWNNSPRIDMSPYSDTLCWFPANQSLLFPLNDACLAKKQKYQFCSLWFEPIGNRTHDLQHSMRARLPLHHRSRLKSNRGDKIFSLDNTEYMLEKRNVHGGYKRKPRNKRLTWICIAHLFIYTVCVHQVYIMRKKTGLFEKKNAW
jgi:hypothetical protein